MPSSEKTRGVDDARRGVGDGTEPRVSRRRASLGDARRGAREQGAQRGTDWHAHDTLDAPPDTDDSAPPAAGVCPVDGRRLEHESKLQFTSPGRARTRPRWRSAAQPRLSRASRTPPRTRGSPPPPSTRETCPAAWRGSGGSPCRPSDPRTMRGTPLTPTSGWRWVSSASVATGASGLSRVHVVNIAVDLSERGFDRGASASAGSPAPFPEKPLSRPVRRIFPSAPRLDLLIFPISPSASVRAGCRAVADGDDQRDRAHP